MLRFPNIPRFIASLLLTFFSISSFCQADNGLRFIRPADNFTESVPLGNGRLGAMVFGQPIRERIVLNEISMWSGGVQDANRADAWQYLSAMSYFGAGNDPSPLAVYLTPDIAVYLAIGLFFAFVPFERLSRLRFDRPLMMMQQLALSTVSLVYSSLLLAANSFNPFIYFRF